MRSYYDVPTVRAAEEPLLAALPDGVLMRRAAFGLACVCARELRERMGAVSGRHVTLVVGAGDNGGDALWAGVFLRRRGVAVDAILLAPEHAHAGGLRALRDAGGRVVRVDAAGVAAGSRRRTDLVLDGVVGIGGKGPLRPDAAAVFASLQGVPVVAVDLPSGIAPDTGVRNHPAVRADVTVTFGGYKPCHALARPECGRVELVDIGLDLGEPLFTEAEPAEVGAVWPVPGPADDKYTQGVVGVAAGSDRYPGAAVLATGGALAATSGMVRYVGSAAHEVLAAHPEVVVADSVMNAGRVGAWVVGPGGGTDPAARERLVGILAADVPVLVDADALTLLAAEPGMLCGRTAPTLLTPHAGEFARFTDPSGDRVSDARRLAADLGVTVLLKGRATIVAAPGGAVLVNDAGSSWAATAGAGDVLAGVAGALLAAGLDPLRAGAFAAHVHAAAAGIAASGPAPAGAPITASALLRALPSAIGGVRAAARRGRRDGRHSVGGPGGGRMRE